MKDIWGLLGKIAIIVTILAGVLALTKWGRYVYQKIWYSIIRYWPKIPRETMRIVVQYHSCWWHLGTKNGKPAMQVHGILNIVNISDFNISICEVSIKKPKIVGYVMTRHSREDIYGDYPIPPYFKTKAAVDFWIQPPICKEGEQLIVDLIFVDQFTNRHRINKIIFMSDAKKKRE